VWSSAKSSASSPRASTPSTGASWLACSRTGTLPLKTTRCGSPVPGTGNANASCSAPLASAPALGEERGGSAPPPPRLGVGSLEEKPPGPPRRSLCLTSKAFSLNIMLTQPV